MKLKMMFINVAISFLVAQGASATLIDNGKTTFDTNSGLSWLDLTESLSFFPAAILEGDGGFLADGWTIASGAQVDALFEQAGTPTPGSAFHFYADSTVPDLLISLLGRTGRSLNNGEFGQGWADNGGGSYSLPAYAIEINASPLYYTGGSSNIFDSGITRSLPLVGVYLVKHVPLPSTIWIMALSLCIWLGVRSKRSEDCELI